MNKIKDKLALMAPSAVFAEGEPLTVTVPAGEFHAARPIGDADGCDARSRARRGDVRS